MLIEVKPDATPIQVHHQYPMSWEPKEGNSHIRRLMELGILVPCWSDWNTPLLLVKKPNSNDYRPTQEFREINYRVMDVQPTVPNPHTLLSLLPPTWA